MSYKKDAAKAKNKSRVAVLKRLKQRARRSRVGSNTSDISETRDRLARYHILFL